MGAKIWIGIFVLLGVGWQPATAQVDLSDDFGRLLDAAGLEFITPVEAKYKDIRVYENEYLDYDFAIRSRKEKLEIRYLIKPVRQQGVLALAPHVQCIRLLTHLASNDSEYIMSGIDVRESDLEDQFNADWGKVFFFTPKDGFASRRQCKMLALHREGQGTAFVFFLFDEPGPALDYRFYALRFREEPGMAN